MNQLNDADFSANSALSGFKKAPVCKFLLGGTIGTTFLFNFPLQHYQPYLIYSPVDLFERKQIWRLFTSKLAYLDLKDLFLCSLLILNLRVFEKRFGSRKFCNHLIGSGLLAILLEVGAMFLCKKFELPISLYPSGPLCLVFPFFVPYYCDIPRVPLSYIWGIPMTGKSLNYIFGLQIASSSPESVVVALCGLLAGILWRVNILKIQSLIQIPSFVAKLFDRSLGRLLDSSTTVEQNTNQIGATLEIQRQERMDRLEQRVLWQSLQHNIQNGPRPQPQNLANGPGIFGMGNNNRHHINDENGEPTEASEEHVQLLVDMGFNQEQVRQALQMSNNDVSVATNFLLQQS